MPREGAEANPACCEREEGAGLRLCSAPEGTSSVGELRLQNCSPGQWWLPALCPHLHQGVCARQGNPEAPSHRSCPASTFPSIPDIPLLFCGVSCVVSLCLREPGRVGTASSSTQLWALQLWGLPCYIGSRFGSRGRFFSAAWLTFSLPGCAMTRCWALGSLPCLARGSSPVLPQFWFLQGQQEP